MLQKKEGCCAGPTTCGGKGSFVLLPEGIFILGRALS